MTNVDRWMILVQLVTPLTAVVGMLLVAYGTYQRLRATVAALVDAMAQVRRDILEIKSDLRMVRAHQQRAADDRPEKGQLPDMKTAKN